MLLSELGKSLFEIEVPFAGKNQDYSELLNQGRRSPVTHSIPPVLLGAVKAPMVRFLELILLTATQAALIWEEPESHNVSHYRVTVRYADATEPWTFVTTTEHSPVEFTGPKSGEVRCIVQTVMRNGYTSALEDSPSVTGELTV